MESNNFNEELPTSTCYLNDYNCNQQSNKRKSENIIESSGNKKQKISSENDCMEINDNELRRSARIKAYEALKIKDKERQNRKYETTDGKFTKQHYRTKLWSSYNQLAYNYEASQDYFNDTNLQIGNLTHECEHCKARKFVNETKGLCCSNGKVKLEDLKPLPSTLMELLTRKHKLSSHFFNNIRIYNCCFQMTSFGTSTPIKHETGYMPTFKINGQLFHRIGSLLPVDEDHKFLQLYFINNDKTQVEERMKIFNEVKEDLVSELQLMLSECNSYIKDFKIALNQMISDDYKVSIIFNLFMCHILQ